MLGQVPTEVRPDEVESPQNELTWPPPPHSNNVFHECLSVARCGRFGRLGVGCRGRKRRHQSASVMLTLSCVTCTHSNTHSPAAARNYCKTNTALQWSYKKKHISSNSIKSGIEFKAGHGLFDQFLMRTVLLNQLEETLFYPQSLRHNIRHINKDHPTSQALNILQASTSLPNGNTTLATVSLFLFKAS